MSEPDVRSGSRGPVSWSLKENDTQATLPEPVERYFDLTGDQKLLEADLLRLEAGEEDEVRKFQRLEDQGRAPPLGDQSIRRKYALKRRVLLSQLQDLRIHCQRLLQRCLDIGYDFEQLERLRWRNHGPGHIGTSQTPSLTLTSWLQHIPATEDYALGPSPPSCRSSDFSTGDLAAITDTQESWAKDEDEYSFRALNLPQARLQGDESTVEPVSEACLASTSGNTNPEMPLLEHESATSPSQIQPRPSYDRESEQNKSIDKSKGRYITNESSILDPETEYWYPKFRRQRRPQDFFVIGKVFMMLWAEPHGDNKTVVSQYEVSGKYKEKIFTKIRRFVVVRSADRYCTALSILSYGEKGVGKPGVCKREHGIIYTTEHPPNPDPAELPGRGGETGMQPEPIAVRPKDHTEKLSKMARIHYGKVYTIEHSVKVRAIGMVRSKSMAALKYQNYSVWLGNADDGLFTNRQSLQIP